MTIDTPVYRNSDELTDDERDTQLTHALRKLKMALDYVATQARDTLSFDERAWVSTRCNFRLPGCEAVKLEIRLEMWIADTLTVHINVDQLDGEGCYSSLIPRHRAEFEKLFATYNPKRMSLDDDGLNNTIFLSLNTNAA